MKTPEEIKKWLECCADEGYSCAECPYESCSDDWNALERDALHYIQQLESELGKLQNAYEAAQSKWISVEERLPDDLEEVLILIKETEFYGQYNELSRSYFCQYIGSLDDGEWYTVWCNGFRYIKDTAKEPHADKLEVTHWLPLPPGPEEE